MSYEPTEWKAGDTITSAKLNKIEQGIAAGGTGGGGVGTVHISPNEQETGYVMDKTWAEIKDMFDSGMLIRIILNDISDELLYGLVAGTSALPFGVNPYVVASVEFIDTVKIASFFTDSENGYPEQLFDDDDEDDTPT